MQLQTFLQRYQYVFIHICNSRSLTGVGAATGLIAVVGATAGLVLGVGATTGLYLLAQCTSRGGNSFPFLITVLGTATEAVTGVTTGLIVRVGVTVGSVTKLGATWWDL